MSPTTYSIEHAKSARSSCKKCKEKIDKHELRIGEHTNMDDRIMTKWHHIGCFALPKAYKDISFWEFMDEYVNDDTDDHILSDEGEKQRIVETFAAKATEKATEKKKESDFLEAVKQNAAILEEEEAEGEEPKSKKAKTMSDDDKALAQAYLKVRSMKNDELKDVLKWNKVASTGSKNVLITRVIDGYARGRIAKCVQCGEGRPKINDDGDKIICTGFFDKDIQGRVSCGSTFEVFSVERLPWFEEKPTEEELEAMEKEENTDAEVEEKDIPKKLTDAVKKLDWDLSSKENIKKAVNEMIRICSSESSPIDFPSDTAKAKMDIGPLMMQNKEKSAQEFLRIIIKKYGMKAKNEQAAQAKSARIENMCAVSANAPICEVLMELSDLYFKEKNNNAGVVYRKVCSAIQNLDFEITVNNAKGLGKGSTKVEGIGKGSADKIFEFLSTGKIEKLEEKRASQA